MRQKINHFSQKIRSFVKKNFTSRGTQGSQLGIRLRRFIRQLNVQQMISVNLAGFAFFAGIVMPQTRDVFSSLEVAMETRETIVVIDAAPTTFQWPLTQFGLSQRYSYYHPGVDLTDPIGTSIYPISNGTVEWVQQLPYGYGKHLLITHEGNIKSLYAHLSEILVSPGQVVTKETEVGKVGITGRSTGSHLHLEVYEKNSPINPIDILPLLKFITPTIVVPPKP